MRKVISLLITMLLLMLLIYQTGAQTVDYGIQSVHDAIYINNDTDMASMALSGSGTADDPYIIGGYEIDAHDEGPALYIGNTTAHFILRNCTLFNSTSYSSLDTKAHLIRAALVIYNSTNVSVVNVTVRDSYYGILIKSAGKDSLNISGNTIDNCRYGIYSYYYEGNGGRIYGNDVSGSLQTGIYSSGNMILENNEVSMCSVGIQPYSGDIVRNNTVHDNSRDGIYCQYASSVRISGNEVFGNREYGIHMSASRRSTIDGNALRNDSIFFEINGNAPDYLLSNTLADNTVNGRPVYLYVNDTATVPTDAGELIAYNSTISASSITMSDADIAIHSIRSSITITSSSFRNFSMQVILSEGGDVSVSDSHFYGNTADSDIAVTGGSLSLRNTDFNGDGQAFEISDADPVEITYVSMEDMLGQAGTIDSSGNVSISHLNMIDFSYPYAGGISVSSSPATVISDSSFMNISNAISMDSCPHSVVENNRMDGAGTSGDGIYLYGGSGGSYTGGCHDSIISNNTVENHYIGIYTYETVNVSIHDNTVENCTNYGIYIFRASGFSIYHNNLIGVFSHAAYESQSTGNNIWNLSYPEGGNYWGGGQDIYSGPGQNESGCDGIVDTPYPIYGTTDTYDMYPLANPTWEKIQTDTTPPVAEFTWEHNGTTYSSDSTSEYEVSVNTTMTFDATPSYDERDDGSQGNISNYTWTFQDSGETAYGRTVSHDFESTGNWTVTLEVTDLCGMKSSVSVLFIVKSNAAPGEANGSSETNDTGVNTGGSNDTEEASGNESATGNATGDNNETEGSSGDTSGDTGTEDGEGTGDTDEGTGTAASGDALGTYALYIGTSLILAIIGAVSVFLLRSKRARDGQTDEEDTEEIEYKDDSDAESDIRESDE